MTDAHAVGVLIAQAEMHCILGSPNLAFKRHVLSPAPSEEPPTGGFFVCRHGRRIWANICHCPMALRNSITSPTVCEKASSMVLAARLLASGSATA